MSKKDKIYLALITLFLLLVILFVTKGEYIFGSSLDWDAQHSVIPEYFRTLFYDNKDLFPDFAFNIGSGQNIYNYSYYGLLSPIILLSYIFPSISMQTFIIGSSILSIYVATILLYFFLKKKGFDEKISFLGSIVFLSASPILFHTHRHIMFVNYMPFLIMGLYGVDKFFDEDKSFLLCLSVFLIIMTSFYYSIVSILCLVIYGVYVYLKKNKKFAFKEFLKKGIKYIIPVLVAVIASGIILFPTAYVILNGRSDTHVTINILELLIPKINLNYFAYNAYGLGFTSLIVFSFISIFSRKEKESRFMGYTLLLVILFPIINYLLNATMYVDAKVLIPLIPLYVILITKFLFDILSKKIKLRKIIVLSLIILLLIIAFDRFNTLYFYIDFLLNLLVIILYYITNHKWILYSYIVVILFAFSLICSSTDKLVKIDNDYIKNYKDESSLINEITTLDKSYYHITDLIETRKNTNNIFRNIKMNQNYIYSSIYNQDYNTFYFDTYKNNMKARNRSITEGSDNLLFLMLASNKYIIATDLDMYGYEKIDTKGNISIFRNNNVLPYMYVSYNNINEKDYRNILFPQNQTVLLSTNTSSDETGYYALPNVQEFKLSLNDIVSTKAVVTTKANYYLVSASKNDTMKIKLPEEAKNKIIFIKFDILESQPCAVGDQLIRINNVTNKLTCSEWKYYNKNEEFTYTISSKNTDSLNLIFNKGNYKISNIKFYYMDYSEIDNVRNNFTEVNINRNNTKGDNIYASVEALDNGYFVTTIPYEKGFSIKVDGKETEYEKVNTAFVGFKIEKGKHNIEIEYSAPYKKVGLISSVIGIILMILIAFKDKRNK